MLRSGRECRSDALCRLFQTLLAAEMSRARALITHVCEQEVIATRMTLLLMALHLAAALFLFIQRARGKFHIPPAMLPVVLLLPLWGPLCAVIAQLHYLGGEKADEEPAYGRFGITDEVYRNIQMEEGGVENVLPMEDVLADGSPLQRRNLLLSVLHAGPEPFVRPLRIAGVNDDTEVVHYAVTALVELRSEFAQRIAAMEKRYQERPSDSRILQEYADLDEEYIRSGIPEKTERLERISHCRSMLEKLLQYKAWQNMGRTSRGQTAPHNKRILLRLGEMCVLQEDASGAEEAGRALVRESPDSEDGYLLLVRARAIAQDWQGICEILDAVQKSGIYLSPAARQQLAFWAS